MPAAARLQRLHAAQTLLERIETAKLFDLQQQRTLARAELDLLLGADQSDVVTFICADLGNAPREAVRIAALDVEIGQQKALVDRHAQPARLLARQLQQQVALEAREAESRELAAIIDLIIGHREESAAKA
jgi:hypothetical protein